MSFLEGLKLVAAKKNPGITPSLQRRTKLMRQLQEQILLAQAASGGAPYEPVKVKRTKDESTGEQTSITVPKRVKQWWWTGANGRINIAVRYGAKALEITKGKNAIECGPDDLLPTLKLLLQAVESGELDAQIESACGALRAGFKR